MTLPICVRHRDGWCARKDQIMEYSDNIKTLCGHFILMCWGIERRKPTCDECIKQLKTGAK